VGDADRLRQVVVNLVGNAIKFTEQGEVVVAVGAQPSEPHGVRLLVSVSDTGIGVPSDKQAVIFEAFTQADGSATRRFGGTGVGLTVASQLVRMMGGRIWMESAGEGLGSTFHFSVCLGLIGEDGSRPPRRLPFQEELKGLPVLVAEDNETSRRILAGMLGSWDMSATLAADAGEVVERLRAAAARGEPFRLALLDAHMPGTDSLELAAHIRRDPGSAGPLILMMSPGESDAEVRRARELGISLHLRKPVNQTDLLDAILTALGAGPQAPDTPANGADAPSSFERPLRVLLAEDHPINRRLATSMLEKRGHTVVLVANGREALAALEQMPFDVVLMDVQMPEMGGFEATAAIRDGERGGDRHLPIIAMTAHAMKGDRELCLEAGMDAYVMKPVDAPALFEAIERVVPGAGRRLGSARPAAASTPAIDRKSVLDRVEGDVGLLKEMVEILRAEYPPLLSEISRCLNASDAKGLERAAHALKGAVSNFGAPIAYDGALRLERAGRDGHLGEAAQALEGLEGEMERLMDGLGVLLEQSA
jgi:CheY-like chemotaxis protein/HPt (histidine-containing phosphotransfer) domain-containing protein